MKIKKLLIANRGEISLRIIKSVKEMGIQTVAVFSEADRNSPHVLAADEAICIGPAPASESYLRMDKIIQAAKDLQADAIHPGYGFLSENAEFAEKVVAAGITFVGPSSDSIALMGSKLEAKKAVSAYDIPLVPGTDEPIQRVELAKHIAAEIGYPILIKASAGGGGKGMRIVQDEQEFDAQMERATSEAQSAFGDPAVFIEKYIESPKHIEIQLLGDQHGNMVYLFERECSIQRRHQKVIEEAPSPVLTPEIRKKMGEAAILVGKSCGYYGAGTVEFLVDKNLDFYFLEMNTRLQVEHPVTECITGLDLVKEQIKIAEGARLSISQENLQIHGHAIEARIYAEDPENQFLPDTGTLITYTPPKGPGIRVDDGFEEGMPIPIHYDPMIAKLTVHAETRELAIEKMKQALVDFKISGIKTTIPFCHYVMTHPQFTSGAFTTKFVENYFEPSKLQPVLSSEEMLVMAAFAVYWKEEQGYTSSHQLSQPFENASKSSWKTRKIR
ncbi:MAG: acetyl-CoA carboxylase biotin carboxylase subunit [Lunatimonas sp.]|uniref:acetyl-CoA carboxylase biotin carboxylase subunit n=1 Tax=Lunatimonas sp. TaxID=2060141 RepID=UPI00263AB01C|nr:acetyl-CoA carboxylase biotin carboxylase subunit [Lunatimonas sp.]MCC5937483.1 acetyl-CoA carboxylase biotin carboxylase subunit [Lunatimonas sp.]